MSNQLTIQKNIVREDGWSVLKTYTPARIALGRTGCTVPLKEQLAFKMAHAHARDAVFSQLDVSQLQQAFQQFNLPVYTLQSKATDRHIYLQRPDFGRQLCNASAQLLQGLQQTTNDITIIVADGLSATAIHENAMQLLNILIPAISNSYTLSPLIITQQSRVAIADEIGALLKTKLTVLLIGERPGLSAADSLGVYITYHPTPGLTDEARNCISNIRPQGLSYNEAAHKILYLIQEAFRLQLTGVHLKENAGLLQ